MESENQFAEGLRSGPSSFIGTTNGHQHSMAPNRSISVALDPREFIITEIITVTTSLRKHPSWAHSPAFSIIGGSSRPIGPSIQNSRPSTPRREEVRRSHQSRPSSDDNEEGLAYILGFRGQSGKKGMKDHPLMAGFSRLRDGVASCKGW